MHPLPQAKAVVLGLTIMFAELLNRQYSKNYLSGDQVRPTNPLISPLSLMPSSF